MTKDSIPTNDKVLGIGARLATAPSNQLIETAFAWELDNQRHLLAAIGLVDIAHTLVAADAAMIPKSDGKALLHALLHLQQQPQSFQISAAQGDIYTNREAWLATQTDAVAWLGGGRARREAITSAYIIDLRTRILALGETLVNLGATLTDQAEHHMLAIMPDYTYLQAAQATTFGHYLITFIYPILRDLERLQQLLERINNSPVGCGSTVGSRLFQGRIQAAELLAFKAPISHSRDAMWQADLSIELAAILNTAGINLSRLAEDLQIYSTQEFGLVELDDRHARASKILPQKKNPFALTHIRAVANKVIGLAATVSASSRTPTGQPDNRLAVYGEIAAAMTLVEGAAALMTEVLQHLSFNQARGQQLSTTGWLMATDLAELLVQHCNLNFRQAHHFIGLLKRLYPEANLNDFSTADLADIGRQQLDLNIEITDTELQSALDPDLAVQQRTETGGTAIHCIEQMHCECRSRLIDYRNQIDDMTTLLENSRQNLIQRAKRYCSYE